MKRKAKNLWMIAVIMSVTVIAFGYESDETVVCPGRGERCAYVKVLGIKIWSKKDKGSPGIIIKQVSEN
jgi:hypothetical protein